MKMLDRYILRSFLMSALMWFVILMSLRIVVDLFVNMDDFAKLDKPFWQLCQEIATYYAYHSLAYFIELGGIIIVVAAAFTVAMMNHTNELTAMMASGVSLYRVAWPIIVCAMLLGGLIVVDEEFVIPPLADKLVRDRDNVPGSKEFPVRLMSDSGESHSAGAPDVASGGSVWYSQQFLNGAMKGPVVLLRDKNMRALGKIVGARATFTEFEGVEGWRIESATLMKASIGEQSWMHNPDCTEIDTPLGPDQIIANAKDPQGQPLDPSQERIVIPRVELTDPTQGLTVQGRFEADPPGENGAPRGGMLTDARFTYRDASGQDMGTFRAGESKWVNSKDGGYWQLTDGDMFYPSDLTPKELALRRSRSWLDFLSTRELIELLQLKRVNDPYAARLTRHVRAVEPINNLIMLLLGLPFILSRERNIKASAGLCLLVVGSFYAFIYICRYMGLPPDLAAWLPVLLFGSVASVTMYSVKT